VAGAKWAVDYLFLSPRTDGTSVSNLLAKSYNRTQYPTTPPAFALLTQHSQDVADSCNALHQVVGPMCLRNAAITGFSDDDMRTALRLNGWLQDLGKANSHFQGMLSQKESIQLLRHETLSGYLAWYDPMRQWLSGLPDAVFYAAIWGAIGHHRKFDFDTRPKESASLRIYTTHQDFRQILSAMADDLGLPSAPQFNTDLVVSKDRHAKDEIWAVRAINDLKDHFTDAVESIDSSDLRRFVACVKALGICGDVAASALARGNATTSYSVSSYIKETVGGIGLTHDDLEGLINQRVSNSMHPGSSPSSFQFRQFQLDVASSPSHLTLAQAGCGSGKSLAAYLWAKNWCLRENRQNFKLFFCLPTTGTTTEHFRDYALESGIDSTLVHSRARVDLRTIAETSVQEYSDENGVDNAAMNCLQAMKDKIESLALWSTPLIVATADTVLGLMANGRRSIYSFPAIMTSAIVFDEIHAFDSQLFGHLLVFLKNFPHLPVLLMTASLPEERKRKLLEVRSDLEIIPGPPEFEELERYSLLSAQSNADTMQAVQKCIEEGGKVLWVRNRVNWANATFADCKNRFGATASTFVYHSRFKYKDRSRRHRTVIDQFKESNTASILVATQVAEMSLDLSADLLVTDLAPPSALIQRLGRLNRFAKPGSSVIPKPAIICSIAESDAAPYTINDLNNARSWLSSFESVKSNLSQRQLVDAFAGIASDADIDIAVAETNAKFFSGLWATTQGFTREEGYTISVLLERDVAALQGEEPSKEWLLEHEVSIPYRDAVFAWERIGYLPIAPSDQIHYDYDDKTGEGTGAAWR